MSKVGLVIPVYKTDFVLDCIDSLMKADGFNDLEICIVNDGQASVKEYLLDKSFPVNVKVLHLPENVQFAAANNAGWEYLLQQHPTIPYLASINDDTIVRKEWLVSLLDIFQNNGDVGMVAPVMESPIADNEIAICESFRLNTSKKPILKDGKVEGVKFVSAISGFCFIVKAALLKEVSFLDPLYRNSCEDIDLCIKVTKAGQKIAISDFSRVLHLEESSRFDEGTQTSTGRARRRLQLKWGKKLNGRKTVVDHLVNFFIATFIDK